jgi:hypothetical protein
LGYIGGMTFDHLLELQDLQQHLPEEVAPGVWLYTATPRPAQETPHDPVYLGGEWDIVYPVGVQPAPFIDYGSV